LTPRDTINVLESFGNTIYAGSGNNTIYISSDRGVNWTPVTLPFAAGDASVTAIGVFGNALFAGTDAKGIFSSTDGGKSWTADAGVPAAAPYALPVTGFAVNKGSLFAGTNGNGIFILDPATNRWNPFDNGLPQIITSWNVKSLFTAGDTLLAAAGENGTFYRYDAGPAQWVESDLPNYGYHLVHAMADSLSIYGITQAPTIYRSDDKGRSWKEDARDLKKWRPGLSQRQFAYAGRTKDYVVTDSAGNTWVQQRTIGSSPGSSWSIGQSLITGAKANALLEVGDRLFAGTTKGIFIRKIDD
jgi:photosystem II stability/assembly factor-like uncharacterized protein